MHWYLDVLRKYVQFSGRARRTEYWMFTLFNVIISIVLTLIDTMVLGTGTTLGGSPLLASIYGLAVLLPSIAVGCRRLHDTNRSHWLILLGLIPLVGGIILIVFFATEGTKGANQYGPDPKEHAAVPAH